MENPWRLAVTSTPWETFVHSSSRRTGYVFRRLLKKMNNTHKIAVFGRMSISCMWLKWLKTFDFYEYALGNTPKKVKISIRNLTFSGV